MESNNQITPPSSTGIFNQLTVFIDPSLPTILALQLKALLTHNNAEVVSEFKPDINPIYNLEPTQNQNQNQNHSHEKTTTTSHPSQLLISNLKPRFDLTKVTHIITNSLQLPEYLTLGHWDQQAGNILSFSYQPQSSNQHIQPSSSSSESELNHSSSKSSVHHRSIPLITPLWVTQSYDLNKLLPPNFYSPDPYQFFSGIVIALDSAAKLPSGDVELIQACVQAWGGQFRRGLTREVTHLICCDHQTKDYQIAIRLKLELGLKIVLPHWFHHSVLFRNIISEKPFEFPSPAILQPRSPSMSPDRQHGIDGLPGNKLPPSRSPVEQDPELESRSYKKATELAFTSQKIPTRPPLLKDSPAYREFQNKSIYLVSSLGLSLSARRTLSRRMSELGAKVYDSGDLKLSQLDQAQSDAKLLQDAIDAEQQLKDSDMVICEHRIGWEFWLAWEQGKQIGTLHWILCILNSINSPTCTIRPPTERLLDFPCPSGPINGLLQTDNRPITISNYTGAARTYLIRLIEKMNMKFSGSLVQNTSMLVAANRAGPKVAYASKNGIQIVNHHYIESCFQSWTKRSIQAHHLMFPDGVDISELVGQSTHTADGIHEWTQRSEVRHQKKRALSVLPSNLIKAVPHSGLPPLKSPKDEDPQPCASSSVLEQKESRAEISDSAASIAPPEDDNPQPSSSPVLQPIDNLLEIPEPDTSVKRVNRKPRLISNSVEVSSLAASETLKVVTDPEPREALRKASSQGSIAVMELDELDTTQNSSIHALSNAAMEVNDRDPTPQATRPFPQKRPSAVADVDPTPSKKAKKESPHIEASTKEIEADTQPARVSPPDEMGVADEEVADPQESETVGQRESSVTSTPLQNRLKQDVKPSISTKKAASSSNAPISATRSSTRKAAQLAIKNVKSAAEDMNLHEQEKKRRRSSGGRDLGLDDGGYFGTPAVKARLRSIVRKKSSSKETEGRVAASDSDDGNNSPIAVKKRGRRSPEKVRHSTPKERKGGPEEEMQAGGLDDDEPLPSAGAIGALLQRKSVKEEDHSSSSDLESITLTSPKKPKKKMPNVKVEEPESAPKAKTKAKSTAASGSSHGRRICIAESGARIDAKISSKLKKMGAKFIEATPSPDDGCTHLLTNKIARTEKFLSCLVLGCFLVTHEWASECVKRNEFVDEQGYELEDSEGEKLHGFELRESLQIARRHKILCGFDIFLTPVVASQHSKLLKKLIVLAGGQVVSKIPKIEELQRTANEINHIHSQTSRKDANDDDEDEDLGRCNGKISVVVSCKEDIKYLKTHLFNKFPGKFLPASDDDDDDDDGSTARPASLIKIFDSNLILQGLLVQEIKFDRKFELDCAGLLS
ncbi:hypothetical protein PCANC_02996 [Puccinia coronata f. sp. avenae]|uniref:BRCT domain-containing protein n=1 Tax=Puccinia coronata f. sp. avenae TaxID=200324 RepID=A0A2N5W0Z4_9BASI|nr:hypothetical protein PCANC_02996 [Puccinia coronata f. sp. avenae]